MGSTLLLNHFITSCDSLTCDIIKIYNKKFSISFREEHEDRSRRQESLKHNNNKELEGSNSDFQISGRYRIVMDS